MLTTELTPSDAGAPCDRARQSALAAEHEDLLLLLTTLRAASGDALYALHFARSLGRAAAYKRLKALVTHGLLCRQDLTDARSVYRLTLRALSLSARVRARVSDAVRRPLPDHDAGHCWLRGTLWAELARQGYFVGRGREELLALRRFLVDEQGKRAGAGGSAARVLAALRSDPTLTPLFRSRCLACRCEAPLGTTLTSCPKCGGRVEHALAERRFECAKCGHASDRDEPHDAKERQRSGRRCAGTMRETDHLPFDVAWRTSSGAREVLLVFVDNPSRDLLEQLRELPLRIAGQPRVPILLRTTDLASVFDRGSGAWICKGDRHRALLRAFSDSGDKHLFPFATTAEVVDVKPELQLRLSPHRRRKDHDHA